MVHAHTAAQQKCKSVKAVIIEGGIGTQTSDKNQIKPKLMIKIGGRATLWLIMKIYSTYGVNNFVICCRYQDKIIREYSKNHFLKIKNITGK